MIGMLTQSMLAQSVLAQSTQAADKLFAAPSSGDGVANSAAGSAGHVTLALLVVLVCVFAAAFALKQVRRLQTGSQSEIKILAQVAVGSKERAVLLQIKDIQILVGVTSAHVNTLHTFDSHASHESVTKQAESSGPTTAATTAEPTSSNQHSFQAILKRSLGLS